MSVEELGLILTLAVSLGAALVFGYVTHRLGLSPIVGYLLAGVAIGPNTPGFVADAALAEQLAEVGVILLMFGVGLQLHLEELLAVRRVAVPGAAAGIAAATLLGALRRGRWAGTGRPRSCSASRSRWQARSCSCACSRTRGSSTRRPVTSRSAGSSSRT